MSDNELYTYFKDRSTSFNELPGDALWGKIESTLNYNSARKPFPFLVKIGIAIIIAGITCVLLLNTITNQKTTTPEHKKILNAKSHEAIPLTKALETDEVIIATVNDTVKKKKRSSSKDKNKNKQAISILPNQSSQYIAFRPITDSLRDKKLQGNELTNTLPHKKTNAITQVMQGRIVVTGERMSKVEFDDLVKKTLETHKEAHGSLIIVKAPGQQTFRHKIQALPKPEPVTGILSQKDRIKGNNTNPGETGYVRFLKVRDTIISPENMKLNPPVDTLILPESPKTKQK